MLQQRFASTPDIVKNLILVNCLVFLANLTFGGKLNEFGAIYYIQNPNFQPYQLVTSFFLHGGLWHLFFNMLVLFFFGGMVEHRLGARRFLLLYLIAGLGANILNMTFDYLIVQQLLQELNPEQIAYAQGIGRLNPDYVNGATMELGRLWWTRALGASGATYGVLFAFAALDPDRTIQLLIPPIPVKAKYLVLFLASLEFFSQIGNTQSNVGHFAHLAGGVIALIMISVWRKQGNLL